MIPDFRAALAADAATPAPVTTPAKPAPAAKPKAAPPVEEERAPEMQEEEVELAGDEEPLQGAPDEAVEAADKALGKNKEPEKKTWKGKFKDKDASGKEIEEEVEVPEEEVARMLSKRRSLDRAAFGWSQKLAESEKKLAEYEKRLADDPWAVLSEKGKDPFQTALSFLKQQVDYASLPPEEKARLQIQFERQQLDDQKAEHQRQLDDADRATKKKSYQEHILRELPAAMDKRGLVKHPLVMSLLNDIGTAQMLQTRSEYPDLEYAAEETEAMLQEASAAWLGNLAEKNPEALIKALPPAVLKAIQAHTLASARKNPTRPAAIGTSPSAPRAPSEKTPRGEPKPASYKTPQEWRQSLIANAHRR